MRFEKSLPCEGYEPACSISKFNQALRMVRFGKK